MPVCLQSQAWVRLVVALPVDEFGESGSDLGPYLGQGGLLTAVELTDGGEAGGEGGGGLGQRGGGGRGVAGQQGRTQRVQLGMARRLEGRSQAGGRGQHKLPGAWGDDPDESACSFYVCVVADLCCTEWCESCEDVLCQGPSLRRQLGPLTHQPQHGLRVLGHCNQRHREQRTGESGSGQVARAIEDKFTNVPIHGSIRILHRIQPNVKRRDRPPSPPWHGGLCMCVPAAVRICACMLSI